MTVEAMRDYISKMYKSDKWQRRVRLMEDRQVIAIYKTMKARGQEPPKKGKPQYEQLNFLDMI